MEWGKTVGHTPRIVVGAVFTFVTIFLAVTIFGSEDDVWRKWFYDYQTMCAGVLAIGAAYLTIVETRRIDSEQARRHRQLVVLQLREERVLAERAALEAGNANENMTRVCFELRTLINRAVKGEERDVVVMEVFVRHGRVLAANFLESEEIAAARHLYPGAIFMQLRMARRWLKSYQTHAERLEIATAEPNELRDFMAIIDMAQHCTALFADAAAEFRDRYADE